MFSRRRHKSTPTLNTAALPDLIFTVLFFFMIATHMRDFERQVDYDVPQGSEVQKYASNKGTAYICIGTRTSMGQGVKDASKVKHDCSTDYVIQVGDRIGSIADIPHYIKSVRDRMSPSDLEHLTVELRIDRGVPMKMVSEVKTVLQRCNARHIRYYAGKEDI